MNPLLTNCMNIIISMYQLTAWLQLIRVCIIIYRVNRILLTMATGSKFKLEVATDEDRDVFVIAYRWRFYENKLPEPEGKGVVGNIYITPKGGIYG